MEPKISSDPKFISSSLTFFFKVIFSSVWIGGMGFGTLILYAGRSENWIVFLIGWIIGSLFIYCFCIRLKLVAIDSENIYISNYFKTVSIPLTSIKKITENCFVNIHPVSITFEQETVFGSKIIFMPKSSWRSFFFLSFPAVQKLQNLVETRKKDSC